MTPADPHLEMAELTMTAPVAGVPAEAVGGAMLQLLMEDLVGGRLPQVVAVTLRGASCRIWRLHDITPVDDIVRELARREEAEAVVVLGPAALPPELDGDRCVALVAECASGGFEHLVVFKAGPEGEMVRVCGRPSSGATPFRWLGVPPAGTVNLWVEGIVGMAGSGPHGRGSA